MGYRMIDDREWNVVLALIDHLEAAVKGFQEHGTCHKIDESVVEDMSPQAVLNYMQSMDSRVREIASKILESAPQPYHHNVAYRPQSPSGYSHHRFDPTVTTPEQRRQEAAERMRQQREAEAKKATPGPRFREGTRPRFDNPHQSEKTPFGTEIYTEVPVEDTYTETGFFAKGVYQEPRYDTTYVEPIFNRSSDDYVRDFQDRFEDEFDPEDPASDGDIFR